MIGRYPHARGVRHADNQDDELHLGKRIIRPLRPLVFVICPCGSLTF